MAPTILICTPIFLPICAQYGMSPVQFGMVMLINCALGLNTPPVGTTQFVGCAIGGVSIGYVMKHHLAVLRRADRGADAGDLRAGVLAGAAGAVPEIGAPGRIYFHKEVQHGLQHRSSFGTQGRRRACRCVRASRPGAGQAHHPLRGGVLRQGHPRGHDPDVREGHRGRLQARALLQRHRCSSRARSWSPCSATTWRWATSRRRTSPSRSRRGRS